MKSQVELRLPPEPIAPTLARAAVAAVGSGLPEAVRPISKLLTTEIVSNASRHASMDPSEEIMGLLVGARGFEPLASSASRKRSTPELSARSSAWYRRAEAGTGIEPV